MRTTSANTGLPLENVQTIHAICLTNAGNLVKSVVSLRHCSSERTKKNKNKVLLFPSVSKFCDKIKLNFHFTSAAFDFNPEHLIS